MVGLQFDNQ